MDVNWSFFPNLGFEESIQDLVTSDGQLSLALSDLAEDVLDLNITLNSMNGQVSMLEEEVTFLNNSVEQMTLSGTEFILFINFIHRSICGVI